MYSSSVARSDFKKKSTPFKPPISAIRVLPNSASSLFVAATVGRISNLFPRWMTNKLEQEHNLTSSQLMVMFLLSQSEKVTLGTLAELLDVTPRAITGMMSGLENENLIYKERDVEDRRVTWVSLNENGKKRFKKIRPDASKKFMGLFEVLSKKEQVDLVRIIEKLSDHMKAQLDKEI